jgi:hypothetical protein
MSRYSISEWLTCTDRNGNPLPSNKRETCNKYRALHGLDPLEFTERTTNPVGSHSQLGKSRGLGDTVAKFTRATGIDRLVKLITKSIGMKDCGCDARRKWLNKLVPYPLWKKSRIVTVKAKPEPRPCGCKKAKTSSDVAAGA